MRESLFEGVLEIECFAFEGQPDDGKATATNMFRGQGSSHAKQVSPASLEVGFSGRNGVHCGCAGGVAAERCGGGCVEAQGAECRYFRVFQALLFVQIVVNSPVT